jgi:DNA gyrase subunit B
MRSISCRGRFGSGTAKQGRDRAFQAILPLRGKILNVEKPCIIKYLKTKRFEIYLLLLGYNWYTEDSKALNIEKLRYHKVIIMCDADVDGSHISTLILTFSSDL